MTFKIGDLVYVAEPLCKQCTELGQTFTILELSEGIAECSNGFCNKRINGAFARHMEGDHWIPTFALRLVNPPGLELEVHKEEPIHAQRLR